MVPGSGDLFIQAGLDKATDSFAKSNNIAWEEVWVGGRKIEDQIVSWPCPGGLSDGDAFSVSVLRADTDNPSVTYWDFRFTDMNQNQVNCTFGFRSAYGNLTSGLSALHWGYFIVETPREPSLCTGNFSNPFPITKICELPAWENPTQESGWLIPACCTNVPINDNSITYIEDILNQCKDYGAPNFQNVAVSPLSGNSWSTAWLTSKRFDNSLTKPCGPDFTFVPYPNSLYFNSGLPGFQSGVAFNSVEGYSGTITPTTTGTPASGLSVSCPSFTLPSTAVAQFEQCNFTSSTAGIYSVNITVTDGSQTHWATLTVIVTTFTTPLFQFVTANLHVSLTSSFYVDMANSSLLGFTKIYGVNNAGTVYSKTKITNFSRLKGVFVDVMSISPYWLSVTCNFDGLAKSEGCYSICNQVCYIYRTVDVNHDGGYVNIKDLVLVAIALGETCSSGCPPRQGGLVSECSPQCRLTTDLDGDGTIDIIDLVLIANSFGAQVFPP